MNIALFWQKQMLKKDWNDKNIGRKCWKKLKTMVFKLKQYFNQFEIQAIENQKI